MPEVTYRVTCAACPGSVGGLYEKTVPWWVENHAALVHPFWDPAVVKRNVHVERDTMTTSSRVRVDGGAR